MHTHYIIYTFHIYYYMHSIDFTEWYILIILLYTILRNTNTFINVTLVVNWKWMLRIRSLLYKFTQSQQWGNISSDFSRNSEKNGYILTKCIFSTTYMVIGDAHNMLNCIMLTTVAAASSKKKKNTKVSLSILTLSRLAQWLRRLNPSRGQAFDPH